MKIEKRRLAALALSLIMATSIFVLYNQARWLNTKENEISENREKYISAGITIISLYYNPINEKKNKEIIDFVKTLPEKYTTPLGEIQIIVEELQSSEEKIIITSYKGERTLSFEEATKENIIKNLCEILTYSSLECVT